MGGSSTRSSRAEIHLATGMVLAQLGISATGALARLRGHASSTNAYVDVDVDVKEGV